MLATRKRAPRKVKYKRPWLYPKQEEALFTAPDHNGNPARIALVEASTKAGKTAGCIAWLLEQAILGRKGHNFWWVAPVYGQAKIAFRRMKAGLPPWMYVANESEMFLRLPNGATLWFKSAEKPDNLYGDDVHAAVLDEASRMREDSWFAIRSTLTATRGALRIIGNVKGRKNWFFRMCRLAQQGTDGMSYHKINAWDAVKGGVLEYAEIEEARRLLPENVFKELYLAEASEDEGNPFGLQHIEACVGELSSKPPAVIGVDLAKSVDWTVVVALDRDGVVCGFERWQKLPWSETKKKLQGMIRSLPALVDSTGVGDPIVEGLRESCYGVEGYNFSAPSKQRLMEGLAMAVQSQMITYPRGVITQEMEIFEYEIHRTGVRYSAPEGFHDDAVMALGLAVEKYRSVMPVGVAAKPVSTPRLSMVDEMERGSGEGALM